MLSARMPFEISDHLLNPRLSLAKALCGFEIKSLQPIVAALFPCYICIVFQTFVVYFAV
jgi:hypothetical protein